MARGVEAVLYQETDLLEEVPKGAHKVVAFLDKRPDVPLTSGILSRNT